MTALATLNTYSGSLQQVVILNTESATGQNMGGPLQREPVFGTFPLHRRTHRVAQSAGKLFTIVYSAIGQMAVYEFDPDAISLDLSADPSGGTTLPVAGDTVTGGTSGATGTLLEDYVAGDNFLVIEVTSGTFVAESLTIVGGTSGSNTATSTAVNDRGGEHFIVFKDTCIGAISGLHHSRTPAGDVTLHGLYRRSGNDVYVAVYDSATDTWSGQLIGVLGGASGGRVGASICDQNTIYWYNWFFGSGNPDYVVTHNTLTGATTIAALPTASTELDEGACFLSWEGGVYALVADDSGSDPTHLMEITGGSPVIIDTVDEINNYSTIAGFVSPDDNALWLLGLSDTAGIANVCRWVKRADGTVVRTSGVNPTALNESIGGALLPVALQPPVATGFARFRDIEDTPGQIKVRLYFSSSIGAGAFSEYLYNPAAQVDSGLAATFNGTSTVTFQNDVSAELAADDWIIVWAEKDKFAFRVDAVVGPSVTISSLGDVNNVIPTGDFEVRKVQILSSFGANPNSVGCVFPDAEDFSGGHIFTVGEIEAVPLSRTPVVGGVRQFFKIFDPGNNGFTDRVAELYFFNKETQQIQRGTIVNSSGSVVSNQATGLTADGATVEYIDWDAEADGQNIGDPVNLIIRVLT